MGEVAAPQENPLVPPGLIQTIASPTTTPAPSSSLPENRHLGLLSRFKLSLRRFFQPLITAIHRRLQPFAIWFEPWWTSKYTNGWLNEFLNLFASLSSLFGVVGIFLAWDQQPTFKWPYKLTLNTVVVILANVSRFTLVAPLMSSISQVQWIHYTKRHPLREIRVIDAASRGVLGSLETIARIRNPLAVSGALLLILALFFDPFIQQGITVKPPADSFPVLLDIHNLLTSGNIFNPVITEGLASAALVGLHSTAEASSLSSGYQVTCNHVLCMSPRYASLDLCYDCKNITQDLELKCSSQQSACNQTLPSGLSLKIDTNRIVFRAYNVNDTGVANKLSILADFELISNVPDSANGELGHPDTSIVVAHRCQILQCASIYQIQSDFEGSWFEIVTEQTTVATEILNSSAIRLEFPNDTVLPKYYTARADNTMHLVELTTNLTVETASINLLRRFFHSMWTGSVSRTPSQGLLDYFQGQAGAEFWSSFDKCAFTQQDGSGFVAESDSSLTYCLALVVSSMAQWLRTAYGTSGFFSNISFLESYYQVSWLYLIFPFALQLAVTVLVVFVAATSRLKRVPVWKSSSLAVLCHGIDISTQTAMQTAEKVNQMEDLAKMKSFRLEKTPRGQRLMGAGELAHSSDPPPSTFELSAMPLARPSERPTSAHTV